MKRIMMLGGNLVQVTAIKAAKAEGYYVISVDNRPDNPGHKFADEYYCVSTVEKEKILRLAKKCDINGICSYASDISASTAAYVAENMGLPTNPYDSVKILTHKDLFRKFMRVNGYDTPKFGSYNSYEVALEQLKKMNLPVMIKPTDSSGSKGVSKIDSLNEFKKSWDEAVDWSIDGKVLIEEFIKSDGCQIDGDIFVVDGKIVINGLCDQHHDDQCAPFTPAGLSYPSCQSQKIQDKAIGLIQNIFNLLNITMGAFNIEYIVDKNKNIHIIEIGPRNGGNLIPDIVKEASGIDLAKYTVRQAVGDDCSNLHQGPINKYSCSYILHSKESGLYLQTEISDKMSENIVYECITVEKGEHIDKFCNSSQGIGMVILNFDNADTMLSVIENIDDYIKVKIIPDGGKTK